MSKQEEERIKRFLKKDSQNQGQLGSNQTQRLSRWRMFTQSPFFLQKKNQFMRFKNESLPMILFVCFSTYMIYKMECQQDEMRQRVLNTKTLKQLEIEKEDEYIRSMLHDEQQKDYNVPIIEEITRKQKQRKSYIQTIIRYKFENDDKGLFGFDTLDDMLEGIEKDHSQGMEIPQEFKQDYVNYQDRKKAGKV